jgi:hypothetical protein
MNRQQAVITSIMYRKGYLVSGRWPRPDPLSKMSLRDARHLVDHTGAVRVHQLEERITNTRIQPDR